MKKYIILFIFLIEACSITPNSRFYQLQAATGDESLSNRKMIIGINDISIPTYVDRPQIVITETDSNELKVSEFNRWAEPLNMSIARVLADDMSLYLPNSLIKPKLYASEDFNYSVTVEINKFDAVMNKKAMLDAWWTIYKNDKISARGRTTAEVKISNWFDGVAEGQSQLINKMAKEIAQKLIK